MSADSELFIVVASVLVATLVLKPVMFAISTKVKTREDGFRVYRFWIICVFDMPFRDIGTITPILQEMAPLFRVRNFSRSVFEDRGIISTIDGRSIILGSKDLEIVSKAYNVASSSK